MATSRKRQRADSDGDSVTAKVFTAATTRKRQRANSDKHSVTSESSSSDDSSSSNLAYPTMATSRNGQRINRNKEPNTTEPSSSNLTQHRDLARCIDKVHAADSGAFIKQLVLQLAVSQPGIAASLRAVEASLIQRQGPRQEPSTRDFSSYVETVDFSINEWFSNLTEMQQHDKILPVFDNVVENIGHLSKEACATHASWVTKFRALEALMHIGVIICDGRDTMGHEIRKRFQNDCALEDAMSDIVGTLTPKERGHVCRMYSGQSRFGDTMKHFRRLSAGHRLFPDLQSLVDCLCDED
ncbi:hypothetical protein E8E13_011228 [Curvularia kusanoi]|uniref:Uncharacterized protein n=1 Tax=Curvularia kusanoi TaxID=90978 RepID=A0A9P4TLQ9_CURKU|nr:hypothetical protein E8E13_011228 [Curvularia kusanoi]